MLGLIGIIVFTTLSVVSVFLFLIFLFKSFISAIRKDKEKVIKNLVISFTSFLLIFVFAIIDVVVIVPTVYKNREEIVDFTVESLDAGIRGTSKVLSRSLIYTADELWNNWDNEFVAQLQKIDVKVIDYEVVTESDYKTYNIEILFNNKNETNSKIEFSKIMKYNYLSAGDNADILYTFDNDGSSYRNRFVSPGKSVANVQVTVKPDTEIIYVNFVKKQITLD